MKYKTAWIYYESSKAIADAAEVSPALVSRWKKKGIIPAQHAVTLENKSGGAVKIDVAVYAKPAARA